MDPLAVPALAVLPAFDGLPNCSARGLVGTKADTAEVRGHEHLLPQGAQFGPPLRPCSGDGSLHYRDGSLVAQRRHRHCKVRRIVTAVRSPSGAYRLNDTFNLDTNSPPRSVRIY